jgi:P-type E1-E2 ATPase
MYCGDGINDLAALAAADVGMAIGSSDASAAASISDKHTSVSGIGCMILTEGLHAYCRLL